jgi:hypothetical protein
LWVREDVMVTEGRDEGVSAVKMNFKLVRDELDHRRLHCADGVIQTYKKRKEEGKDQPVTDKQRWNLMQRLLQFAVTSTPKWDAASSTRSE